MQETDKLTLALQEGEGYKLEFKERVANLDREIVALANAAGGSIFIGVDDKNQVIGVNIDNKLKSQVIDIARNCDPSIKIELISHCHNDLSVLEVHVAEGHDKPYRCKDGFFLRIGPSSQKLKRDEIVTLINHGGKIHFDEAINKHFQYPNDFSKQAFTDYLTLCGISSSLETEDILQSLNLAVKDKDKLLLNNAGVLCFAEDPQQFFPEAYITAVAYKTNDRFSIIDKKDFHGSLIKQIDESLIFIARHIDVSFEITPDFSATRKNIYAYPPTALREAIINAVTHRDYAYDGSHIYIHIFPDYIEIENPGGLYRGLTIEDLGKRSVRRNRLIADVLHRANYIERVGSGFSRMQQALSENNNPDYQVSATNFFNIRFLKRLKDGTPVANLTRRQIEIYQLMQQRSSVSKKDIATALNVSDDTALRELNALIVLKIIGKEGVGKATSYYLCDK